MRRKFKASFPIDSIGSWIYERSIIDKSNLDEIQRSIHRSGVVTPIILRKVEDKDSLPPPDSSPSLRLKVNKYQGLGGYLRVTACQGLGITQVPAVIYSGIDDLTALDITLIDNIQHQEMTDWDIANLLRRYRDKDLTLEEIATRIQKSTSYISQKLAVLEDSLAIQKAVEVGEISESQARYVRRLPEELHETAIQRVTGETVRDTRVKVIELQEENKAELIKIQIREKEEQLKAIDELEKSREKLRSEESSLKGKLKALKVTNKQMNGILRTVETLEKDYFPTLRELEAYREELTETQKLLPDYEVDELVKDRQSLDTEIGSLDAKVKDLQKKLKDSKAELKKTKKERSLVQEKITEFNTRQRKVRELKGLTEKLTEKVGKMEEKLGDAVERYEPLKATLEDYEKQVLNERLDISKQIKNLQKEIGSLSAKIGQRSRINKEIDSLKEELKLLEAEGEEAEGEEVEVEEAEETKEVEV